MIRRPRPGWKGLFYGVALPILARLEPARAETILAGLGRTLGRSPKPRAAIQRIGNALGASWNCEAVARELVAAAPRLLVRDVLLDRLDDAELAARFDVIGREHLDGARAGGRGVVLLGSHFAAHVAGLHWLIRQPWPLRLMVQRPSHVSRRLLARFDDAAPPFPQPSLTLRRGLASADSAHRVLLARDALRAGTILYLNGDVAYDTPGARPVRFLGECRPLVRVWHDLAQAARVAVVPVFCTPRSAGRFELVLEPPLPLDGPPPDGAMSTYLAALEARIARCPAWAGAYFRSRGDSWGKD